jgi:hypothetical protein
MSNCRGGIGHSTVSQLSSSELLAITRDATQFFGQRTRPTHFRSASEAQAYRKMLTIAVGVNGPRPVASAVIAAVQAAVPCGGGQRTLPPTAVRVLPTFLVATDELEDVEGPEVDTPVEDLSVDIVPVPAVSEEVAREARLDALWELQKYAAPAPKTAAGPSFGGSAGSGDIAPEGSVSSTLKPFSVSNPMRVLAQTT